VPVVKSGWFMGCFAETVDEADISDIASYLGLICNALSLLHTVIRSPEVLHQLCLPASCKHVVAVLFFNIADLLVVGCAMLTYADLPPYVLY